MPSADPQAIEGVEPRRAALRMLDQVLRRGLTLDRAARTADNLAPVDRALALAIAGETLRRIPDLDALIDGAMKRPVASDSKARMVLRLALAQKVALDTPDHALVATALPLVDGGPRRLVHGVLGGLLRKGVAPIPEPRLPAPVEDRWARSWGSETVEAARRLIGRRPPLDLTFADEAEAIAFAEAQGGVSLAPRHVRIASSGAVSDLPGFGRGRWWVQDLAASLPARLVPPGETLDLCAAPGGKTMQLSAAGNEVTAIDLSRSRLDRLSENLDRTRLKARLVVADALDWTPGRRWTSILLDAPCSATGTFRRHPEVLHRAGPRIIAGSAELQQGMLDRSADLLEPGGTLVYSVCSLEPEEGEQAIERFLERKKGFEISSPKPGELPDFARVSGKGWVRLLPGLLEPNGGTDGFFLARLVRSGD